MARIMMGINITSAKKDGFCITFILLSAVHMSSGKCKIMIRKS
jgi:hypothetical protein